MPKSSTKAFKRCGGDINAFQMYCGDGTFDSRRVFESDKQLEMWLKLHKRKCETCRIGDEADRRMPNYIGDIITRDMGHRQTIQEMNCPNR
jgi:hypothetical protein